MLSKWLVLVFVACLASEGFALKIRSKEYLSKKDEILRTAEQVEVEFEKEYMLYAKTGVRSERLNEIFSSYQHSSVANRRQEVEDMDDEDVGIFCIVCRSALSAILMLRRIGVGKEQLADISLEICVTFDIQTVEVCKGLIDLNIESILHIVDNRSSVNAEMICSLVLQGECGALDPEIDFTIDVDDSVGEIEYPKSESVPRNETSELRIIHITDPHYDPHYMENSHAHCREPVCCRAKTGVPENPDHRAGFWGDYRDCDSPWIAVVDAFEHIRDQHEQIDIVYYTGDIVDHGIWETTFEGNIYSMDRTYQLLQDTFPNSMILPLLGNHEAQPVNVFGPRDKPESMSAQWLYDYSAEAWAQWLPDDALETVRIGGYYTILVRPGFRVVALNNNECYTYNWWILYSRDAMVDQLNWLHDTLLEAEREYEKVHILAHIPSGEGSCYEFFSREYGRIVERFHETISGQFNGHTHRDEFNVFYSRDTNEHAINVAWNGGSTTSFSFVNPNYIMYYVDTEIFQVNEFESWIYNLTEANEHPDRNPIWYKHYSFKEDFDLEDLSPASLDGLIQELAVDREKLTRYWQYKVKAGDPSLNDGCNEMCLLGSLCKIVTTQYNDNRKCQELRELFEGSDQGTTTWTTEPDTNAPTTSDGISDD